MTQGPQSVFVTVPSVYGPKYQTVITEVLDLKIHTIYNLGEAIDQLCEMLGDKDDPLAESYCPYFGQVWPSGVALAEFLKEQNLAGKKILELGCGLAIPSFMATKLGAIVLASDFHKDVPTFLELNQKLNQIYFKFIHLNWREESMDLGKFDIVMGSDILYESKHASEVAQGLIRYLAPGGKIFCTDPGRTYIQKFVTAMNELGAKETLHPRTTSHWDNKTDIFVFEFSL